MTNEKALVIFKNLMKGLEEIIINALEKQIPKEPVIHGYRQGRMINTISYTCPACNKHIGRDKHCKNCGQAILWEGDTE